MDKLIKPLNNSDRHLAAHLFNSERLTLAREFRALTKVELAFRIGRTPSAISQFESGRLKPDPKTVASFALALGLPIGFFARKSITNPLTMDVCHFRSLRSAKQKERRRLLSIATVLYELMILINEFVELPQEQVPQITKPICNVDDIEDCAVEVRRAWGLGLGPISNIMNLLENNGILISFIPETCRAVDAFSFWCDNNPLIFLVNDSDASSRLRFDAAHELGHLVMHVDAVPGSQLLEREAHRFAGAFLVPRESFLDECPRYLDWEHFYELKRRWKVSVAALVKRAFDLGCISASSYRRAFVQLNKRGERLKEPDEPPMERPNLLSSSVREILKQWSYENFALQLGLSVSDLKKLISA